MFALAGVLSVPSVVLAESTWYGSLRAGIELSEGNIAVKDGESRWGIKGSAEVGEGLTVVYRFEHKISSEDASQPEGRLAYVGLSGGFGSVTVGQIWSASYNAVGTITDNTLHYGVADTTYRIPSAISYAYSNNLMSLQLDTIYGGPEGIIKDRIKTDPTTDLQAVEFGLSVNVGEIGKIAVAYIDDKYVEIIDIDGAWRRKFTYAVAEVHVSDLTAYVGSRNFKGIDTSSEQLGEVSYKTTFFGFRGGLGDSGIKYLFQLRDIKSGSPATPWVFGLTKSLGGGASINVEHADNDDDPSESNGTRVNLTINF